MLDESTEWGKILTQGSQDQIAEALAEAMCTDPVLKEWLDACEGWETPLYDLCSGSGGSYGILRRVVEKLRSRGKNFGYELLGLSDKDPTSQRFLRLCGHKPVYGNCLDLLRDTAYCHATDKPVPVKKLGRSAEKPAVAAGIECGGSSPQNAFRITQGVSLEDEGGKPKTTKIASSFFATKSVIDVMDAPCILYENNVYIEGCSKSHSIYNDMCRLLAPKYSPETAHLSSEKSDPQTRLRAFLAFGQDEATIGHFPELVSRMEKALVAKPWPHYLLTAEEAERDESIELFCNTTRALVPFAGELTSARPYYERKGLTLPDDIPAGMGKEFYKVPADYMFKGDAGLTKRGRLVTHWGGNLFDMWQLVPFDSFAVFHAEYSIAKRLSRTILQVEIFPTITEKPEWLICVPALKRCSLISISELYALNGMPLVDLTPMSLTDLCARFTYHELSSLCGRAFHAPSGAIALLALMLMHKPTCEALARRALPSA